MLTPEAMSALPNLYYNKWSHTARSIGVQADVLGDIIYGFLVFHLSTPSAHQTWDEPRILSSLKQLIFRAASANSTYNIPPSTFIRALVPIMNLGSKCRPRPIVAIADEALLLYLATFHRVASTLDPTFTPTKFQRLHRLSGITPGSMACSERMLGRDETAASPDLVPFLQSFIHYYLAPFIPLKYQRTDSIPLNLPISQGVNSRPSPRIAREQLVRSSCSRFALTPILEEVELVQEDDGANRITIPLKSAFYTHSDDSSSSLNVRHPHSLRALSCEVKECGRYYKRKWISNVKNAVRYSRGRWRGRIPRTRWRKPISSATSRPASQRTS